VRANTLDARLSRRRIGRIGICAAGLALASACSQWHPPWSKKATIGYMSASNGKTPLTEVFLSSLRNAGWVEDATLTIDWRFTDGHNEAFVAIAADLAQLSVDLIVVTSSAAAGAAKSAATSIPIVMISSADPVALGLVASLAHPGGNVTGLTSNSSQLAGKRLEMFKAIVPGITRIAVVGNSTNPGNRLQLEELQSAAVTLGLTVLHVDARAPEELSASIELAAHMNAQALVFASDSLSVVNRTDIADLALANHLPFMYADNRHVAVGGLASFGPALTAPYRRAAVYIDEILRGTNPGELPIDQPREFEVAVNTNTARLLGVTLLPAVAAQVTEWVQ
jgi:putative tryptophan/tyrosine transport system substrate-binding protein